MPDTPTPLRLDRIDFAILRALQRDARMSLNDISAEVSLTTSPCWARIPGIRHSKSRFVLRQ